MIEISEELVGKRVLWRRVSSMLIDNILEGKVKEIAPSGKYIKIDDEWEYVNKVEILEVL